MALSHILCLEADPFSVQNMVLHDPEEQNMMSPNWVFTQLIQGIN